ncbi:hypothetical protein L596_020596 [Steinernema carpocapsae]|uniref:G-protein coupled receptors family 1 profile domain-containing protein n=1 Tax=Steinernema carpocapsae TaxID=34508 RepID=A0A4U5MUS0_STECR|nr:hypothetical protein L596_020596 [Steinernema carpocapsae]
MQSYLWNDEQYRTLYRCDYMNVSEWQKYASPRPMCGALFFIFGAVNFVSYLLCLVVIRKNELFQYSCFKMMFLLGIIDILAVVFNSGVGGYFMLIGSSYCVEPDLHYITGSFIAGMPHSPILKMMF